MSPETFTGPDGREYFRHVPGDEMPCDGEKWVHITTRCGIRSDVPNKARLYRWTALRAPSNSLDIIGWRYSDEQPTKQPWPADAPDGQCWECPDCGNLASLGGNAGFHRDNERHGEPRLITQPTKIPDPWKDEREKLEARVRELEAALSELYDWQNGCPLPTWDEGWNNAMELARKALNPHIPKVSPQ